MKTLEASGDDIHEAIARVSVPAYLIDSDGVIRWINGAAREAAGDIVGRQFTSVLIPEDRRRAQEFFARKVAGTAAVTDGEFTAIDRDSNRFTIEVSSVPLRRGGHVIGVFGLVSHLEIETPRPAHAALTPRQAEVLHLLEHGRSTRQIAAELHLSIETVRNHIRGVLKALNVHSRLEAVAVARSEHLFAS